MRKTVYLSVGSNLGDREANLQAALDRLHAPDLRVARVSPVYETEPLEFAEQGWFLNRTPRGRVATETAFDYFGVKRKLRSDDQPALF